MLPSPLPVAILGIRPIRLLVEAGVCVICAGGGGIPVVRGADGNMEGVEAVIDKDRTSALLAQALDADVLLMLTDVEAVFRDWGGRDQSAIGSITPDALEGLMNYRWPGNIRELANVLERAQILAEGDTITTDDLPENLLQASKPLPSAGTPAPVISPDNLEDIERRHVIEVLGRHKGNKVHAAKALGISRRTLYRLIVKYGLAEGGKPTGEEPRHSEAENPTE